MLSSVLVATGSAILWDQSGRFRPTRQRLSVGLVGGARMSDLVAACAALYAVILVASALGKVDGWSAWADFVNRITEGLPRISSRATSILAPAVELGIAAVLLRVPGLGLKLGAALFACFAIVPALRYTKLKGEMCACFGTAHQTKIGRSLILRNLVLAGLAIVVTQHSPSSSGPVPLLAICSAILVLFTLFAATRLRENASTYIELFGSHLIINRRDRG